MPITWLDPDMPEWRVPIKASKRNFPPFRPPVKTYSGNVGEAVDDLLQKQELNQLLGSVFPDRRFVRVFVNGESQPDNKVLRRWQQSNAEPGWVLDRKEINRLIAQENNVTFLLRFVDTRHRYLRAATESIKRCGYDVATHAFITIGGGEGLGGHVDTKHRVIWVQNAGLKQLILGERLRVPMVTEVGVNLGSENPVDMAPGMFNVSDPAMSHRVATPRAPGFSVHTVFNIIVPTAAAYLAAAISANPEVSEATNRMYEALHPPQYVERNSLTLAAMIRDQARVFRSDQGRKDMAVIDQAMETFEKYEWWPPLQVWVPPRPRPEHAADGIREVLEQVQARVNRDPALRYLDDALEDDAILRAMERDVYGFPAELDTLNVLDGTEWSAGADDREARAAELALDFIPAFSPA